jgi:glucose-6-phosphate 1-dehydrogenase
MTAAAAGEGHRRCMQTGRAPGPLAMVIFGGTGDLSRRKLVPALYRLFCEGLLPESFALVGAALEPLSDEQYRELLRAAVVGEGEAPELWARFAAHLTYVGGDFADPDTFQRLRDRLHALDRGRGTGGNRLFYMAVPPTAVCPIVSRLGEAEMIRAPGGSEWSRVVVEKPFGTDLDSARTLNARLLEALDESQVYRIDHYLGKETVQNLLVFRFANVIWEPVWSRQHVDHVQITVAEEVGVGSRAGYYEGAGALRDMVQSHLLQLLCLVAMEPPAAYDADSIRNEKVKVLQSVRPVMAEPVEQELVRGQYGPGRVDGSEVPGYREEAGVDPSSGTESFVALRLWVDNWRWAGVPFFLRTGKRMAARATEIVIQFHPAPHPILDVVEGDLPAPNLLVLRIQPEEGISLRFEAKVPGLAGPLRPVEMDFSYAAAFRTRSPAAYERLLLDAMLGDPTLFARRDEVEAAWQIVTPVVEALRGGAAAPLQGYPAGSWGPPGADALLAAAHRRWRVPDPASVEEQ